jgi:small subunit ribosomal protein S20
MANTKSAQKRARQSEIRRDRNSAARGRMRTAVKKLRKVVAAGDKAQAAELLPATLKLVDATAQKRIIHGNTADRTKSRLAKAVQKLG